MGRNKKPNRTVSIFGDGNCGKRSLVSTFKHGQCMPDYQQFSYETFTVNIPVDGKMIPIDIDTSNLRMTEFYHQRNLPCINLAMICFSIDNLDSLKNVHENWIQDIRHFYGTWPVILVACKVDLRTDPEIVNEGLVTSETGRQMAARIGADGYIECSAKTSEGIKELFSEVVRLSTGKRFLHLRSRTCNLQ